MIVVDTNILAYLYLPTEHTAQVERLLKRQPVWAAPVLWKSELRNVLALYLRKQLLTFEQASAIQDAAERLMAGQAFEVPSQDVLRLVNDSSCSAYDCEFVALARHLRTRLVTADKKLLKEFPDTAISLSRAVSLPPAKDARN